MTITTVISQEGWNQCSTNAERHRLLHHVSSIYPKPVQAISGKFGDYFSVISQKVYGKKGNYKIIWTNGHGI